MKSQMHVLVQVVGLLLTMALVAVSASAQNGSYSWGGQWGQLTWTYTVSSGQCGNGGSWTEWTYNNVAYTTGQNQTITLGGGGNYYYATLPVYQGCPPTGPEPAEITYGSVNNGFIIQWYPGSGGSGSATLQLYGDLLPRYMLLSLMYAPPGHASNVTYSTTSTIGTSTDITSSFTSGSSISVSVGATVPCGGSSSAGNNTNGNGKPQPICSTGSGTYTSGSSFTQEQDSSRSVDISQEQGFQFEISGPQANSCPAGNGQLTTDQADALGLDHDWDQFIVWLNPAVSVAGSPYSSIYWNGYQFNNADPADNIHTILLDTWWLKDPNWLSNLNNQNVCNEYNPGIYTALQRTWDSSGTSGGPAITQADLNTILTQEPYVNDPHASSTAIDTTRYAGPLNYSSIQYETNQNNIQYNRCYDSSFSNTLGYKDTYTDNFGWGISFNALFGLISANLNDQSTMTNSNGWSKTNSQKIGQCATLNITGPIVGSGYSGPVDFNVYQDNIYGTLMLNPVN